MGMNQLRWQTFRIPVAWKTKIEKGRMPVISLLKEYQKYVTKAISAKRNDLTAHLVGRALIIHASEGGSLEGQVERWKVGSVDVTYLSE